MLAAKIIMTFSAGIVLALGLIHLIYTFYGSKLTPRNPALQIRMDEISPRITKETTMWRCWTGFNASHSTGLILFGLIFGYLALVQNQLLFNSPFLLVVGLVALVAYAMLCKFYFFRVPLAGVCISLLCYLASVALSRM